MAEKRVYESIKFTFGETEMRELGQQLARENQAVYDHRKRKKELDAELAASIEAASGRVEALTIKVNNGYEMRELEVLHIFDAPKSGMKHVIRLDTGEILREEPMTLDEKQRGFGFTES